MISSDPIFCQCRPIAQVNALGTQIARVILAFSQPMSDFALSEITLWIKSKNTKNQWYKIILSECKSLSPTTFELILPFNPHCKETKLLYFDEVNFTQVRSDLSIKIQFHCHQIITSILPMHCFGVDEFKTAFFKDFSYCFFMPEHTEKKHPLIICLHGAGEGGNNQSHIFADKMAITFWNKENHLLFDYPYILAPQCPSFWLKEFELNHHTYYGNRDYTDDLLALIKQFIIQNPNIDLTRIYLIGGSMGGYQGLRLFSADPTLFAAALIACPAQVPTDKQLSALSNKPIWFLHSYLDQVVPVKNTEYITQYLKDKGNHFIKETYFNEVMIDQQEINPHCVFIPLYENQPKIDGQSIFNWLAQQKGENI